MNPERPWPSLDRLREITADSGFDLRARLTAHPSYVLAGEPWIDPRVSAHVAALADDDGFVRDGVRPTGLPWQEPDGGFAQAGSGRVDLHTEVDTEGRTDDRRSDFDEVYGDWDEVADLPHARRPRTASALLRLERWGRGPPGLPWMGLAPAAPPKASPRAVGSPGASPAVPRKAPERRRRERPP